MRSTRSCGRGIRPDAITQSRSAAATRRRLVLAALLTASLLAACGGSADDATEPASSDSTGGDSANVGTDASSPASSAAAKYAGRWRQCISIGAGTSKLDTFELEVASDRTLRYRHSRTYHGQSGDCSLGPGETWESKPVVRGQGVFELLGATKIVDGIESEKAVWDAQLPSDFDDAPAVEKTTLGLTDGMLYIGDTSGEKDADGFPQKYYHVLIRVS